MKRIKHGGRTKGTPNKVTADLRTSIKAFLENNFDEVQALWHDLEPIEKIKFYKDLLPYAVPKMQSIEATFETPPEPITGFIIQLATPDNNKTDEVG